MTAPSGSTGRDNATAVAIIGLGARLPDAQGVEAFWQNIVSGRNSIADVPADRWDPQLYWDADRQAADKTYSKIGGWVTDFEFGRKKYRLPPLVVDQMDPTQTLALEMVHEALDDSGYLEADFDRQRCAVILGTAMGGDQRDRTNLRAAYWEVEQAVRMTLLETARGELDDDHIERILETLQTRFQQPLPEITEDTMPGELANVVAGRVASQFNLRGPNFITDAACASSLAAIDTAVRGLQTHRFDMAVSGGVDRCMGAPTFVKFSKIGALSPDGSRPFDADANGFVMGEGGAALILKRLDDAERDGDDIYAIIRGIGASSDGKGKGITAPNPIGQHLSVRRAYQEAGYGPRSVSLFEAHGTSTPVGDPIEANSLLGVLADDDGPFGAESIGIGSVKSMIGHLKAGAGAASMVKAALAIKRHTLAPTINVDTPNPRIDMANTRLRIQTDAQPWETIDDIPRRAGVSAFGFGGTNFHVALEEYIPGRADATSHPSQTVQPRTTDASAESSSGASDPSPSDSFGSTSSPSTPSNRDQTVHKTGMMMFAGDTAADVQAQFDSFAADFDQRGLAATGPYRLDLTAQPPPLPAGRARLAISYSADRLEKQVSRTRRAFERGRGWRILSNQGIFLSSEDAPGQLAMLFPGQGAQYIGMLAELRDRFEVIAQTFEQADQIMAPILGRPLTSIIFPDPHDLSDDEARQRLRQTEVTQPAVLTVNVALLRLFGQLGIAPDMVAGHSLGEYAACVAAGVMGFADALRTVAARGTQMAKATPMDGDKGLMASISKPADEVQAVLDEVDGYVVCANKNCPQQTIIAGLTAPVEQAIARFEDQGSVVQTLNVSHAFHTKVVAAASEPLRAHLDAVDIQAPSVPILTNVTGQFYPDDPDEIRDLLAKQLASPVEYIALIERMYDSGAHTFVEVGPKRAQTTFVDATLRRRDHLSTFTNHPKEGGEVSLNNALALLWAHGIWTNDGPSSTGIQASDPQSDPATEHTADLDSGQHRQPQTGQRALDQNDRPPAGSTADRDEVLAAMLQILCDKTGYDPDEIAYDFELEADLGIDTVKQAEIMADVRQHFGLPKDDDFRLADYPTLDAMADYVDTSLSGPSTAEGQTDGDDQPMDAEVSDADSSAANPGAVDRQARLDVMLAILCAKTGYDPDEIAYDFELEADLGIDTVKQAEIMADVRQHFGLPKDDDFRLADYPTLDAMAEYVDQTLADAQPAAHVDAPTSDAAGKTATTTADAADASVAAAGRAYDPVEHDIAARISVTGSALGLPGLDDIFDVDAVDRLLDGQNFIGDIPADIRQEMVDKHITRLQKHKDGGGKLVEVDDVADVIKLSGRSLGEFDLSEWGISEDMIEQLDHTSQLAIAAGINALRDAGLPMVPRYRTTRGGQKLTIGWTLPDAVGDETGVIFASAFAGADALVDEVTRRYTDQDYQFNHRFLVRVLGMANARFAEMIGARGPNTRINNACASTTTAIAMAEDWIRADRCQRVVIISADDASGEHLMDWVGSGFLATGAATTKADVTEAALPFDKRRHGMIIGMGAVGLVVERHGLAEARGLEPLADVMATHFVNSAHHPTRLDVDHIAGEVGQMLERAENDFDLDRHAIADKTVFVSHETYTPARGGSADAEISALRDNFGDHANDIVIANTKGYTGHAMGAGIEDVLAVKALQHQRVPSIANFEEPDPNLGDLRLSDGGQYPVDYALRLAAGFGSQLAVALLRYRARDDERVFNPRLNRQWLADITGYDHPQLSVQDRTLRVLDGQPDDSPDSEASRADVDDAPADQPQTSPTTPPHKLAASEPAAVAAQASPAAEASPGADSTCDVDPAVFEPRPIVVEAHTAAAYDLFELRANLADKHLVIVGGPLLVTNTMVRAAERCGASVHLLEDSSQRSPLDTNEAAVCDLCDEDAVTAEFDAIGRVDGIINLVGFGQPSASADAVYRAARTSFHVARAWQAHLGKDPGQGQLFVSLTGMGGRLGLDRSTHPMPLCGAVGGLTKALGREFPDAAIRMVDVAREGFYPELGLQVLAEAYADAPSLEVGLIGGVRYVPVVVDAEVLDGHGSGSTYAPTAESVVVIVGGAKGITAEVALDLAERFGPKLALVGRTRLSHPDPLAIDMDAQKKQAKQRVAARGDRVTPVRVRAELKPFKSQKTIANNLERLRRAGCEVEYFSCDVAACDDVQAMFERINSRFGSIDGVIHAAGVDESKRLADKDLSSFDRVFRGKALGGLNLWEAAAAHAPKFFVTFSSVAGRFGNAGQVDYSAANEVLNKLVAQINATSSTRALSIDWTAWDDVGMATDGSMRTILEARGVQFLPRDVGAPIVGQAMKDGLTGEFLVAGDLGEMTATGVIERSAMAGRQPAGNDRLVFVDRVADRSDTRAVVERIFDAQRDYFLDDHVYQDVPVLPGVMGYEFMVQAAHQVADGQLVEVADVQFNRAVKFHRGQPLRLIATAELRQTTGGDSVVDVTLESKRKAKTGRILRKTHFSATVSMGDKPAEPPKAMVLDPTKRFEVGPDKLAIYRRYFHTGRFQVLEGIPHVGDDVVIGYGRKPTGRLTASQNGHVFVTDPMVREMAFQAAGLWGMKHNASSYLPHAIGRSRQFGVAQPGEGLCLRCRRRQDAPEHAIGFDIEVFSQHGRLLQVMEKVELIGHRALEADETFEAFEARRLTARRLTAPEARLLLGDLDLDVDDILQADERQAYDRLRSQTRRGEWLAARVAAKDLVSCYCRDFWGIRPDLADVLIAKDDHGAPRVQLRGSARRALADVALPHITITHSHGVAIAALAGPGEPARVGVDLERIEDRGEAFADNYFTDAERALNLPVAPGADVDDPSVLLTALWSIKEAVSKALGLGLQLSTDEVTVATLGDDDTGVAAEVNLSGRARTAFDALSGQSIDARLELDAAFAFASVRLATAAEDTAAEDTAAEDTAAEDTARQDMTTPADTHATSTDPDGWVDIAAVAALLEHKGLLARPDPANSPGETEPLSPWQQ